MTDATAAADAGGASAPAAKLPRVELDALSALALGVGGAVAIAGIVAVACGVALANVLALGGPITGACLAIVQRKS